MASRAPGPDGPGLDARCGQLVAARPPPAGSAGAEGDAGSALVPHEGPHARVAFVPSGRLPPGAGSPLSAALVLEARGARPCCAGSHWARASPVPGALSGGAAPSGARAGWDGPGRRRRERACDAGRSVRVAAARPPPAGSAGAEGDAGSALVPHEGPHARVASGPSAIASRRGRPSERRLRTGRRDRLRSGRGVIRRHSPAVRHLREDQRRGEGPPGARRQSEAGAGGDQRAAGPIDWSTSTIACWLTMRSPS